MIKRNNFVIQLSGFAEIYTFLTSDAVVSVLLDRHIKHSHHRYDVICDHDMPACAIMMYDVTMRNIICYALKLNIIKKSSFCHKYDIHFTA